MVQKKIPILTQNTSFANATGKIDYQFTNDYMFRAIFQKNKRVLKALICSLLHLDMNDIKSITVTNPIELGNSMDEKDFILDITVLLNNNQFINLEMQVENLLNWRERSLSYLCRSFDQLYSGQEYINVKPAIHIGFLNFTPFKEHPEFYATYKLLNEKSHHLYSDKFILSVVDLTQIELATDEDKAYQIDYWARLFKAETWEELRMISKNNSYLTEASEELFVLNADEIARQKSWARNEYYRLERTYKKIYEDALEEAVETAVETAVEAAVKDVKAENANLQTALCEKNNIIADAEKTINALQAEIDKLKTQVKNQP